MVLPDSCRMVDRWLRVYFSVVKTEALYGDLNEGADLQHELAVEDPTTLKNIPSSRCWHQTSARVLAKERL